MQEKYNIKDTNATAQPDSPTSDRKLYGLPNHKSYRVIGDQDPEIKRIVSYRGRLSIKVKTPSRVFKDMSDTLSSAHLSEILRYCTRMHSPNANHLMYAAKTFCPVSLSVLLCSP